MTNLEKYRQAVLRDCQLRQLEMLLVIDDICKRHDINYWLDGGTLLGAVRHGGFIPWDDDIDIAMTASDLTRFCKIAPFELPATLLLQTPEMEETKEPIVKVRDLNSFCVEPGDDFAAHYEKGLFIDIFPFIPYPAVSRSFAKRVLRGISRSKAILLKPHRYSWKAVAEFFWFGAKYALCRSLWQLVCILHPAKYADNLGNVLNNNGYGIYHRTSLTFPLSSVTFEGHTFPAPADTDAYLRDLYGDYMTLPPLDKRVIHTVFMTPKLIVD